MAGMMDQVRSDVRAGLVAANLARGGDIVPNPHDFLPPEKKKFAKNTKKKFKTRAKAQKGRDSVGTKRRIRSY